MKGAIENCCRAEQEIMKKVREAYENDVAAMSVSVGPVGRACRVALEHLAFGPRFTRKRLLHLINGFFMGFLVRGRGLISGFKVCEPPGIDLCCVGRGSLTSIRSAKGSESVWGGVWPKR